MFQYFDIDDAGYPLLAPRPSPLAPRPSSLALGVSFQYMTDTWWSGALRTLVAWLAIALVVWVGWLLIAPGDRFRATFVLLILLTGSAVFSPLYGGIAYLTAKRRAQNKTAKGALWTTVALCIASVGALVWGFLLVQAIGRGLR